MKKSIVYKVLKESRELLALMGCTCCCHFSDGHTCSDKGCQHCKHEEGSHRGPLQVRITS